MKEKHFYTILATLALMLYGGGITSNLRAATNGVNTRVADVAGVLAEAATTTTVETGYYYIVSNYSTFVETKAIAGVSNNTVFWENYDITNPRQLWYFKKLSDGNYYIINYYLGTYLGKLGDNESSAYMPLTETPEVEQVVEASTTTSGIFHIKGSTNTAYLYAHHANTEARCIERLGTWKDATDTNGAAWKLLKASDSDLNRLKLAAAAEKAWDVYMNAEDFEPLITSADQISANSENTSWGSRAALLDGDITTCFHSNEATAGAGWSNIQFSLGKEVNKIKFYYSGRDTKNTFYGWDSETPNNMTLYATNDETLGASTNAADSSKWTKIADLKRPDYAMPANCNELEYNSPIIDFGENSYKYLRFVVRGLASMQNGARGYYHIGDDYSNMGIMYNLGEMQIYNAARGTNSLATTKNMEKECDALLTAINAADAKVKDLTATITDADLTALDEAVSKFDQYVQATDIENVVAQAKKARELANDYTLVTDASQIKSNAQSGGDESPKDGSAYAHLIDNDQSTIFHSSYDGSRTCGWQNLQVTLGEAVSAIKFYYKGRGGAVGWCDNPDHITVYATNDDALGASTASADSASWTKIVDMTDKEYNFPAMGQYAEYTSPAIDFGGTKYKYVRFVVRHVVTMNEGGGRTTTYNNVDLSAQGVFFELSEFHVTSATPTNKSLCYTMPEMTTACEALDAAITDAETKIAAGTATLADEKKLATLLATIEPLVEKNETLHADNVSDSDMATADNLVISGGTLTDATIAALKELVKNEALTALNLNQVYTYTPVELSPANPNLVIYDNNNCVTNTNNVVRGDGALTCDNLVITDGYAFGATLDFTATNVSYDRKFLGTGDSYYSTVCLPFTIETSKVKGLTTLYEFSKINTETATVSLESVTAMEAAKPYVVTLSTTQPFLSLTGVNATVAAGKAGSYGDSPATFGGTYATITNLATTATQTVYGFADGKFVKVGEGCTFNPFRCYITVDAADSNTLPASLNLDPSGGTVGITPVATDKTTVKVYTTDGVLVGTYDTAPDATLLPAGIYIMNGKKILVK